MPARNSPGPLRPSRRAFVRTAVSGIAGASLLRSGGAAFAQGSSITGVPGTGGVASTPLRGNLVLLTSGGANIVAMTGADGVLLVDGGPAEQAGALLQAVAALPGGARIHTLFNTHWHPEQTGLNPTLGGAGTRIVAHANTRLWLSKDITRPWEDRMFSRLAPQARPTQTFYANGRMDVARERVEYGYLLQAHTDGDAFVFFPASNVLAAGGVVCGDAASGGGWPLIDWWTGGWIGGLADGLETLLSIGDAQTRVVPAQGPVLTQEDVRMQHEMFRTIDDRLKDMLRKGLSPDEAIAAQPTKEFDAKMGDPRFFIRRAFESLWPQLAPDA